MRNSNVFEPRVSAIVQSQLQAAMAFRSWMPEPIAQRAVIDPMQWARRVRREQQRFNRFTQQ